MKLKGKTCLVTGGSRGIGRSIVENLAAEGADVIFTYLQQKNKALDVVNGISNTPGIIKHLQMDVSDRNSIKKVIESIDKEFGKLDVLVNNAGINFPEDFDKITDEDWDSVLSVNLKGPFIVTQEAFTLLSKPNDASVINIGSVSGQYGGPRTAHYAASKAGLISLGQVIARFGAKYNIRCNTVAAGLIASEMANEGLKSEAVIAAAENIMMNRFGSKEEIAKVVVFLASDESSYITAQTINVNGGLYF